MTSPTQRSLDKLREQGWQAGVVEKWNPHARVRQDLFGFIDIVALRDDVTMAVQATSYDNVSHRIAKIADNPFVDAVRKAGWRIVVWGWRKHKGRWVCREADLS